jgi:hypothetical protein
MMPKFTIEHLLWHLWLKPATTKSDYVRKHTDLVAKAASDGLITTADGVGHGNIWRVTPKGAQRVFTRWRID